MLACDGEEERDMRLTIDEELGRREAFAHARPDGVDSIPVGAHSINCDVMRERGQQALD